MISQNEILTEVSPYLSAATLKMSSYRYKAVALCILYFLYVLIFRPAVSCWTTNMCYEAEIIKKEEEIRKSQDDETQKKNLWVGRCRVIRRVPGVLLAIRSLLWLLLSACPCLQSCRRFLAARRQPSYETPTDQPGIWNVVRLTTYMKAFVVMPNTLMSLCNK